jgi:hypothetical protein
VLNIISRSKFDLQPVVEAIAQTAARLCVADMVDIRRREGNSYVHLASYGWPADSAEYTKTFVHDVGRGSIVGRVTLERKFIQIPDVLADPEYTFHELQRLANIERSSASHCCVKEFTSGSWR